MLTVVVDRKRWLRGEGESVSFLFRPEDGKMCCVGFAANAAGLSEEMLRGVRVLDHLQILTPEINIPRELEPLCEAAIFPLHVANALYVVNDDESMTNQEREKKIYAIGLKLGLSFEFVD